MSAPFTATKFALLHLLPIVLTACLLMGCSATSMPPLRPTVPQLPAQVVQACHLPSPLADGNVSTLISALLDAWEGQAVCEIRRAAAVRAYEAARRLNP